MKEGIFMTKFKKSAAIISVLLVFAMLFAFAGCKDNTPDNPSETQTAEAVTEKKNYTLPDTPVEVITEQVTFEKLEVETGEYSTNADGSQIGKDLVQSLGDLEIVQKNYYVYRNTVASLENFVIDDDGLSVNASAYADVKISQLGSGEKEMKIAYTAYDADGNVVRKTYMLALLDGVKEGDTVKECRIDLPRNAVKIEFENYVGD